MHSNRQQIAEAIRIVSDQSWLDDYKLNVVKLVGWLVGIIGQNPLHPGKMPPYHRIRAAHFGLMTEVATLQCMRLFDIFGYKDPGKGLRQPVFVRYL